MTKHGTASIGQYIEFQTAVLRQLPRPEECDANVLDGLLSNQASLKRILRDALLPPEEKPAPVVIPQQTVTAYPITVDYGMKLGAMIAAGRYDWARSDITAERFPVEGEGTAGLEAQLVHFGRDMEDDGITRELDKLGLRDGAIEELLAFGAMYPDLQREFPIVARKSVWQDRFGYSDCPYLDGGGDGRCLGLYVRVGRWYGRYRFLAFRK